MTLWFESFWVGISVALLMVTLLPCVVFLITYNPECPEDRCAGIIIGRMTVAFVVFYLFSRSYMLAMCPIALAILTCTLELNGVSVQMGRRWIAIAGVVAFVCVAGKWSQILWGIHTELNQVPVVSLNERLEYEAPYRTPDLSGVRLAEGLIQRKDQDSDPTTLESLKTADGIRANEWTNTEIAFIETSRQSNTARNSQTLKILLRTHRNTEFQFRLAAGFGISRLYEFYAPGLELDLPKRPLIPSSIPNVPSELGDAEMSTIAVNYVPWHTSNLINFADPRTLGYVEWTADASHADLDQVIGFIPHGFASKPEPPQLSGDVNVRWQLDSLQLVSLLKHRPGAVYLTSNLPNMAELAKVSTRALDQFEGTALQGLKQGEEVVVVGNDSRLRMMGAIRAGVMCMECHQVPRGTLLGAFTYQFSRINRGQPASPINKNGWHMGQAL